MARDWANEHPDAPDVALCPRCRLVTSYDEETGLCYRCLTGRTLGVCEHDGALTNPFPVERDSAGRVLRWRSACTDCGAVVVIDADSGQDAGQNVGNVGEHGPNLPSNAA